jgi:3-hydroxybutyrate dehydrogenase
MLAEKTALITGSLDGIGFGIAKALAEKGAKVMLNGFGDQSLIDSRIAAIKAKGVDADYHGADVSNLAEIEDLVRATEQRFGAIDILVNNAVTRHRANIEDFPVERWDYAIAVNLTAPFHLIRLTMPGMKQRRWGRILNLASVYSFLGTPERADYCTTKHGLLGLTRVVALEGLPFNITCHALCPGTVDTPNTQRNLAAQQAITGLSEAETLEQFLALRQPSRRLISPDKIGALAAFLCSDDASDMTGAPISMDGGWLSGS